MKSKIRIAIDGNEANVSQRVGSNIYAFEIIASLEKLSRTLPGIEVTVLLASDPLSDLPAARTNWSYKVIKPTFLWTQFALPAYLFVHKAEYDVFYTPGHYAPRMSQVSYISSVMDLGFLKFPEQFKYKDFIQLRDWTAYSVRNAAKVIAISEFTKHDVIKTYHRKATDVVVAYPDIDSSIHPVSTTIQAKVLKKYGITESYLLYVGTLQPRKNLIKVIEAFEQVQKMISTQQEVHQDSKYNLRRINPHKDVQLVIAGKIGWLSDEITNRIAASPVKDHIILTGYVDDNTKNALYQGATGAILVGLYEGFGIPPLEAMAHGVIPVASNSSSLPEVVGKAGILVDPTSTASIADGLTSVLLITAKERAKFRREARKQIQHFSWLKSAKIILDTLVEVANHK